MNEDVMVVKTADLQPYLHGHPYGLIAANTEEILRLIAEQHFFIDRPTAEVSPQTRQIIPYVVIRHGHDIFTLRRTAKQNEARLHHKVSIGIGGHINPGHDLLAGLRKELEEEVAVEPGYQLQFAGILNDESTDVGRVHLGAVYLLDTPSPNVTIRETEKMTGQWVALPALAAQREAMETWSQIVYDTLL
jgi:predicted NUDIX family phosphoesterase